MVFKNKKLEISLDQNTLLEAFSAKNVLEKSGISLLDAARIVANFSELGKTKKFEKMLEIFKLGHEKFIRQNTSIEFECSFEKFLAAKTHLRERTLADYRNVVKSILKKNPKICTKKISEIDSPEILKIVENSFNTIRQRNKARSILHAYFAFSKKRNWCFENPVSAVDFFILREREIVPLNLDEISKLLNAAKSFQGGVCLPAIAIMLFAGVRPREIERLYWSDIDWEENVISIAPEHSKTGGIRHVSILPRLRKIIQKFAIKNLDSQEKICPPNWTRKWRRVRQNAGWSKDKNPWQQDVLRHTFASYHLKFFKDVSLLQCEMGHSSTRLLRTRYLSMRGLTNSAASDFWNDN